MLGDVVLTHGTGGVSIFALQVSMYDVMAPEEVLTNMYGLRRRQEPLSSQ
jgi:hypothetical protein